MGWPFDSARDNGDGTWSFWVDLGAAGWGLGAGLLTVVLILGLAAVVDRRSKRKGRAL